MLDLFLIDNPAGTVFDLEEEQTEFNSVKHFNPRLCKISYLEFDKRLDRKIVNEFTRKVKEGLCVDYSAMRRWPYRAQHITIT